MIDLTFIESSRAPVSVVIPLYNKASLVLRAINSVLAQSRQPAEVIVVDDGSTDGGAEVASLISDPRLRLLRQSNCGVSAARNAGIAAARSELIAFLDADDQWMPNFLQTVLRLKARYPQCDVFGTSYSVRTATGADQPAVIRQSRIRTEEGILPDYFDTACRSDPPLCSSSVAVSKAALNEIGGFPPGITQGEDLLTWARLAARCQVAYCLRPSAVVWCPEFDDARPTRRPQSPDPVSAHFRRLLEVATPAQRKSLRRYLGLWHRMRGSMFLRLDDRDSARAELRQSLSYSALNARSLCYALAALSPVTLMPATLGIVRGLRQFTRRPRATVNGLS